jgi:hypothetical protein
MTPDRPTEYVAFTIEMVPMPQGRGVRRGTQLDRRRRHATVRSNRGTPTMNAQSP